MGINPHPITAPIGPLATSRADRWALEDPRRTRVAAPPSLQARAARAEKVAEQERPRLPAEEQRPDGPDVPQRQLAIRKDPEIDRVVVQVLDAATGEVVRQIPSEEWVRHLKRLRGAKGLFVDQKG